MPCLIHEAIFLATCNAMMTTEKHCKLQRGRHTFAIFFTSCNALGGNYKYMSAVIPVIITTKIAILTCSCFFFTSRDIDVRNECITRLSPSLVKRCFSASSFVALVFSAFFRFDFTAGSVSCNLLTVQFFALSLNFFSLFTTAAILKSPLSEGRALIGSMCQNYVASYRGDVILYYFKHKIRKDC